jgi:hypothetical protein
VVLCVFIPNALDAGFIVTYKHRWRVYSRWVSVGLSGFGVSVNGGLLRMAGFRLGVRLALNPY